MKIQNVPVLVATSGLAAMLLLDGCGKSNNQQPANQASGNQASGNQPSGNQQPASSAPSQSQPAQEANPPAPPPDQQGAAGSGTSSGANQPSSTPPAAAQVTIPASTRIRVRTDEDLGSKISQPGQAFGATLANDVVVNGQTVIPRGSRVEGTVVAAKALGRFKGGAMLELRLERVRTPWGSYPVATSTMVQAEQGKGKRTGLFAGGGGAFGAIVGGLAGGGKGALIGGLAGAGAGTAGSAMTGNKEIFLPAETLLTFRLERPVHVTKGGAS